MINNINELDEKLEELESSIPTLPYKWQISPYGSLEHLGNDIHCYQRDEAEILVKALYEFYFPEEKEDINDEHSLDYVLSFGYSNDDAQFIRELYDYFKQDKKPLLIHRLKELKHLRMITMIGEYKKIIDLMELDVDLVDDFLDNYAVKISDLSPEEANSIDLEDDEL